MPDPNDDPIHGHLIPNAEVVESEWAHLELYQGNPRALRKIFGDYEEVDRAEAFIDAVKRAAKPAVMIACAGLAYRMLTRRVNHD